MTVADLTLEQRMACALAEIARSAWEGGVDYNVVVEAMYRFELLTREVMTAKEAKAWGYQMDLAEGDDYDKLSPDILKLENAVPRELRV